jgi:hypothetical protein
MMLVILKLCAAAALNVGNVDKESYSVINEDYIIDNRRHTIYPAIVVDSFTFLLLLPGRFGVNTAKKNSALAFPFSSLSSF